MTTEQFCHVYGPVPSRRLGRSLGVDLVPFKTCTYDCVYCQLGRTTDKTMERKEYVPVDRVLAELRQKLAAGPQPDYISLAGSGEPTLNLKLGSLIRNIKAMTSIPVAVLTNGSLLWLPEVREELQAADLVLPSLDAGTEKAFQLVNRPHHEIGFEQMVQGLVEFSTHFAGSVWLEVLLLSGLTGNVSEVRNIASLVEKMRPARVQLNTVCRPPAEETARALGAEQLLGLAELIPGLVEVISEDPPVDIAGRIDNSDMDGDLLALLSRRPCTVHGLCSGLGLNPSEVSKRLDALVKQGQVVMVRRNSHLFFKARTK
jgi:wyosine [tRNA(Phe)-imidazoG37] synthetase (radical SAM superfamily)